MLYLVRSYPVFFETLATALPHLTKVAVTVYKDLQKLSWGFPDDLFKLPFTMNEFGRNLLTATPQTCWQYMKQLQKVSERFTLTSLDVEGTHDLRLPAFLPTADPDFFQIDGSGVALI